jgi:DNA-directed RNA polymerase specialized sigma24 family protein
VAADADLMRELPMNPTNARKGREPQRASLHAILDWERAHRDATTRPSSGHRQRHRRRCPGRPGLLTWPPARSAVDWGRQNSSRITFTVRVCRDNGPEMSTPANRPFPASHPLQDDRARLEHIADLMWDEIHSVLRPGRPVHRRGSPGGNELTLIGGTSAEDVLQEAVIGLLRYQPAPGINWEGLGVTIAHNKAVAALRMSGKHRGLPDGSQIQIASLDIANADGEPLVNDVPDPDDSGFSADEAIRRVHQLERLRALRRIAQENLTDRDRQIVFRHQRGETFRSMHDEYGITEQRAGQIYRKSLRDLRNASNNDPAIQRLNDPDEGGNPNGE